MAQRGMLVAQQSFGKARAITKSDATVYSPPLDAFVVGANGNVVIVDNTGTSVTIPAIAGHVYHITASQVLDASTATGIIGLNW